MASVDSSNFPALMNVGAIVRFGSKLSNEFFKGTVYTLDSDDGSFAIDDVSRTDVRGIYHKVEGFYQFFLKDIKDLTVLVPGPKPPTTTTNTTTKDDQKTNPGDASSSNTTKDDKKSNTNPGDASSSNTTKDDQKSNPGDASSSTSPSK